MVHADASNFATNITKEQAYEQVFKEAEALLDGQRNWVCNLSNTASLLWHVYKSLPSPSSEVNWAGFYTLCPTSHTTLILGPFQGKVACQTISISPARGVCGTAASTATTQLVADVEEFPGHIACDGDSRSEIVVPIVVGGVVKGIIDVDCKVVGGFDEVDRSWLEKLAVLLGEGCDWP